MTDDTKLPLTSDNPTEALLAQLREQAPNIFSEGKVDWDKLKATLGEAIDARPERYGLTWAGKAEAFRAVQTPSVGTLLPMPEESVNFDSSENLIIEGDNLEVLKLLQKSYHGKVKMIYIDPPYNTGNEFIYPDNFREGLDEYLRYSGQVNEEGLKQSTNTETSGRFHSKWLSMMYPRLFMARNLLRDDGVIFVSIDDNEVHNLRMLMNEVFGEENFIAQLVWEKTRKNDAKLFSVGHDYIVVFGRSLLTIKQLKTVWRETKPGAKEIMDQYRSMRKKHGNDDSIIQAALREWYSSLPKNHPSKKLSRYKWVDKYGPWRDRDISWPGGGGPRYDVPHPTTGLPCKVPERGWGFATWDSMKRQIDLGLLVFREDHTEPPFRKAHLVPVPEELDDESEIELEEEQDNPDEDMTVEEEAVGLQVMPSVLYKQSQVSVKYLRKLLGGKLFENPKDHEIITKLVRYCTQPDKESIVLDFFAGSGTMGEAILRANVEDDSLRQFILVQLPEPIKETSRAYKMGYFTIAQITRERVRRVINKLNEADAGKLDLDDKANQDRGFRAFKLSSSNFKIWDADRAATEQQQLSEQLHLYADNLADSRSQQDVLYELILKSGLPLTAKAETKAVAGKTVHSIADGNLLICLENPVTQELLRGMIALEPLQILCLDAAFHGNDPLKTNAVLEAKSHDITFRTV